MNTIANPLRAAILLASACCFSGQAIAQIQTTFTEPGVSSELAAGESGIISKIHVKEGDYVTKGTVLAELDQQVLQKTLAYAKAKAESSAAIERSEAKLKYEKLKYQSLVTLDREGHANRRELQLSNSEYEQALAELKMAQEDQYAAQIDVRKIEAQLESRLVRSPFDGVVTKIHKKLGEYISANASEFAALVTLQKLHAQFYLLYE